MAEIDFQALCLQTQVEGLALCFKHAFQAYNVLYGPSSPWQNIIYPNASNVFVLVWQRTFSRDTNHKLSNVLCGRVQTRVNATKLQRQDTAKIREKRKQKEQEEAASAPVADPAIKQAVQNGDGPLVLPDFTPLTNGNRCVLFFAGQGLS